MTFLNSGFLGTRGTFLSDLLIITVILLIPLFTTGFLLARRHHGSAHRLTMLTLYSAVVLYVVIYIVHVLSEGLIFQFRGREAWALYAYWILGTVHSVFAVTALVIGWQTVQLGRHLAKIGPKGYYLPAEKRPIHAGRGRIALVFFALTAVTGLGVYYLLFAY